RARGSARSWVGGTFADRSGFTTGRCRRPGRPPRDDHLGRPQDAISEAVAGAIDVGDLPFIVGRVLFVSDGLVDARIEEIAFGPDRLQALLGEQVAELLTDQVDALGPGVLGD